MAHERARQRHALLLAAGQLARAMVQPVAQADLVEQFERPAARAPPAVPSRDQRRNQHVLQHAALRQQVVILEHEADLPVAERGQAAVVAARTGRCRRAARVPALGGSSAPRMCSSVLLPLPDGPDNRRAVARPPGADRCPTARRPVRPALRSVSRHRRLQARRGSRRLREPRRTPGEPGQGSVDLERRSRMHGRAVVGADALVARDRRAPAVSPVSASRPSSPSASASGSPGATRMPPPVVSTISVAAPRRGCTIGTPLAIASSRNRPLGSVVGAGHREHAQLAQERELRGPIQLAVIPELRRRVPSRPSAAGCRRGRPGVPDPGSRRPTGGSAAAPAARHEPAIGLAEQVQALLGRDATEVADRERVGIAAGPLRVARRG